MLNGRIGQVIGPFTAGVDLLDDNAPIGVFTPETTRPVLNKLGVQTSEGNIIKINGFNIKVGKTGIYELDNVVAVTSLIFPNGADADTIVDFIY